MESKFLVHAAAATAGTEVGEHGVLAFEWLKEELEEWADLDYIYLCHVKGLNFILMTTGAIKGFNTGSD